MTDTAKPPLGMSREAVWPLTCAAVSLLIVVILWPPVVSVMGLGGDYQSYMHHARTWLATGELYPAYQLTGPYESLALENMFPPVILWLLVPFTGLPWVLWWAVPAGMMAWALVRLRPRPGAWPVMALCASAPFVVAKIVVGSPTIWVAAFLSVGVVTAGPAVFVLLKPSLAPFALWGIRHRRWWLYLAAFGVACLPFGSLWLDYVTSLRNATNLGPLYSLWEAPLLLVPVVAWVARTGRAGESVARGALAAGYLTTP